MNIYVHLPYCSGKCLYCDFYSVAAREPRWDALADAILREAATRIPASPHSAGNWPDTLYMGGGTPSLMPEAEFRRLADGLAGYYSGTKSFTVEVNPEDVSPEKARIWRDAGVNRVSMGVQSLADDELKAVGRRHSAERAREAAAILRDNFDDLSLDLIFGLPGQTLSSLERSVEGILAVRPDHLSVYSLMYEERTALTRLRDMGKIRETDEDLSVEMYRLVRDRLRDAGFEQYEISNYARPGHRSIHNSLYWRGIAYVGLGPGAHSYDGLRTRRANLPDLRRYLAEEVAPHAEERLTDDELREEMVMTRLRTREGLPLDEYSRRFGREAATGLGCAARPWIEKRLLRVEEGEEAGNAGNVKEDGDLRLSLTPEGVMVSDEIIISLI